MTDHIPLATLRKVLSLVFPMQGVIVVGAGRGQGLEGYHSASTLMLIDARAECVEVLRKQSADWPGLIAVQAVIAGHSGSAEFHIASKPDESGLIAPEALQSLWRNLITRTREYVETSTLPELLGRLQLTADCRCNWLVVDCLPALPVLQGAGHLIDHVDVIEVRCVCHETIAVEQGASLASTKQWLEPFGFRLVHESEETLPLLRRAVFCRDSMKQDHKLVVLQETIDELQTSHDESLRSLTAARDALEKRLQETVVLLQRLQNEAQLGKDIQRLADQLSAQNAELSEQLAKQSADLGKLRKQLLTAIKQEILNGTQQLEAFLDIQNFFKHGKHLPALHGWPVSPDFARYLIQLLEKNDYDLILEFGSGASTVIIAKTLAHLDRTRQGKPAALQIAFEHLEKYHDQTHADLESAGLAQSVELTLDPLQPYQPPNGNTYPYYACHEKLADVATRLSAMPIRTLLVVDGPPASTGQHARYPALPAVLAHLKGQCLDILLDDYARPDEKEVGVLWEQDLEQLGYKLVSEKISMEKEALFISASPQ